jgi:predicted permease
MLGELRIASRALSRSPGFVAVVVVSLAIGIGSTTTAYSWIDSFLLRPLPAVPESERLIAVHTKGPGGVEWSAAYPRSKAWRENLGGPVQGLAVFSMTQLSLRTPDFGPERVFGALASGDYFDVLGIKPQAGRIFTLDDERSAAQVAVISDVLWTRVFHRDPAVIGRQVNVNSHGFTIVGVTPPKFAGSTAGLVMGLWVPVTTRPVLDPGNTSLTEDGWQWLDAVARLAPGATLEQGRAALDRTSRLVAQSLGDRTPTLAGANRLSDTGAGPLIKPLFLTLFGLAGVILLIACANVTNLLLVRSTKRSKELGIRIALGAGRGRVIRQLLLESGLLAAVGGAAGVLLAFWGRNALSAVMPSMPFPVDLTSSINLRVVAIAMLITAGTTFLVGVIPALRASRPSLVGSLKGEQLPGSARSRLRSGLVVAQVALSLVALVSGGLFYRSLQAARATDPGFRNPDQVLVATTGFRLAGYPDSVARIKLDQVLERIRQIPAVTEAGITDDLPVQLGNNSSTAAEPDGYRFGPDENHSIDYGRVSRGYFEAMGIQVVRGRSFQESDRADGMPVLVVSEAFVKRYLKDRDPIGAQVKTRGRAHTVVGVVRDVVKERVGQPAAPYMYFVTTQYFADEVNFIVRAKVDPRSLIVPVRAALQSVDPNLPLLDPQTMAESMAAGMFVQSTGATLLGFLGLLALGMATVGLYGVLSFAVSLRTREIGVRIALGAAAGSVVRMVVGHAARLVMLGGVIGGGLAVAVGTALRSQLFGVQPADPVTLGLVAAVLAVVAVAAAAIPARRATRISPTVALKAE